MSASAVSEKDANRKKGVDARDKPVRRVHTRWQFLIQLARDLLARLRKFL